MGRTTGIVNGGCGICGLALHSVYACHEGRR
jgi:hypothetical protein